MLKKLRVDMRTPYWFKTFVQQGEIADETAWLQLGQESNDEFVRTIFNEAHISYFADWPTKENPELGYKFCSSLVLFDQKLI